MARLAIVASRDEYIAGTQGPEIKFAPLPKSLRAVSEAPPERLLLDKLHATGAPDTALRLYGHNRKDYFRLARDPPANQKKAPNCVSEAVK